MVGKSQCWSLIWWATICSQKFDKFRPVSFFKSDPYLSQVPFVSLSRTRIQRLERESLRETEMEEGDGKKDHLNSPANSEQTISDDEELDYTTKPEFYDSDLDNKDEKWIHKKRQGRRDSDAVLSCPACFTTLCLECQRHEKYVTQYRAVFAVNCKIENKQVVSQNNSRSRKRNRGPEGVDGSNALSTSNETFKQVCCSVCSTEVGAIDEDEVFHFFNVLPSES